MSIDDWRRRINELDSELLQLLNERARIAVKVGESKKEAGVSLCDHTREREVIERMFRVNEGPLDGSSSRRRTTGAPVSRIADLLGRRTHRARSLRAALPAAEDILVGRCAAD
jgi:chorismate mutase